MIAKEQGARLALLLSSYEPESHKGKSRAPRFNRTYTPRTYTPERVYPSSSASFSLSQFLQSSAKARKAGRDASIFS